MRRISSGLFAPAWRASVFAALLLASCSPTGDDSPPPPQSGGGGATPVVGNSFNDEEASRFLMQATFGPTMAEIDRLTRIGGSDWIRGQYQATPNLHLVGLVSQQNLGGGLNRSSLTDSFWSVAASGDDQLRQRVAYALSQIVVVGAGNGSELADEPLAMAYYLDILTRNALGNYRDILEEVTYSPAMAIWLTYLRNERANPDTGSVPDENYAREILQLFSIGLVELEPDGAPRAGNIETYDTDDVIGLARVFTGLSLKSGWRDNSDPSNLYSRLVIYPERHSPEEKTFLGLTIPANTPAEESIDRALDHIFNHPNVGPFISRQLIQRLTTSDPSPAYVRRVVDAFERGAFMLPDGSWVGTDQRGDMRATVAAILFDQEARQPASAAPASFGKVREPVLRLLHWARAFEVESTNAGEDWFLYDTSGGDRLGQHPLRSPSVFNFYRPYYVSPGGATGGANITAPELQIMNETTAIGYVNTMSRFVRDQTPNKEGASGDAFRARYLAEIALAEDPARLLDRLNLLLMAGRMEPQTRSRIEGVLNEMSIRADRVDDDRRSRVHVAVTMAVTSPEYIVQR